MTALKFNHEQLFERDPSDPDLDPKWSTVYITLCDYVQPDSKMSLAEAVDSVAQVHYDGQGHSPINSTLICMAEQIPYDNLGHAKLANFFYAYGQSNSWLAKSVDRDGPDLAKGAFYQKMNENLSDEIIDPHHPLDDGDDLSEWTNAHAFRANLMSIEESTGIHLMYLPAIMRDAMRDAFRPESKKEPLNVRNALVMGAAQYPKWAASGMLKLAQRPGEPDLEKRRQQLSPDKVRTPILCFPTRARRQEARAWRREQAEEDMRRELKKRWPVTWDQWQAWKKGFRDVATDDAYSSTCRQLAEEAADAMAHQEKMAGMKE